MGTPRIAVVGMGGFAQTHRRYVSQVEEAELGRQVAQVAIPADQVTFAAELREMRSRGITVYPSLRQMLGAARREIDIVCIPTGIPLHRPMTIAALEAGCHVLVEKPAAGSIQDVDAMLAAAARADRLCAVGFQHVYQPEYRRVHEWVCAGRFGRVRQIKSFGCWPRDPMYYGRNGWAGRLAVDDTWVLDAPHNNALAHAVNAMLFMASASAGHPLQPVSVQAELYRANPIESADTAALRAQTDQGVEVLFAISHCTDRNINPVYVLTGEEGRLELTYEGDIDVQWGDGSRERLKAAPDGRRVLEDVAAVVSGSKSELACPLAMARAQTLCTCGTFESSAIHEIPADLRLVDTDTGAVTVTGMTEAVLRAHEDGALFSELGLPWARPGELVELSGYSYFPTHCFHTPE